MKFVFRYIVPGPLRPVLARWMAFGVIWLNPRRRRVIVGNLTPLVGAQKARQLAPRLLGNFLMTAVDFFCARSPLARQVESDAWHRIEDAYQESRRVMIVTAHIGNWEIGISSLIDKGYPVAAVYAATYTRDAIVQWIMSHRNPHVHWIPTTPGAADICVAAIEQGRVLCIAADIPFGEHGRRTTVAGCPARLPMGPWSIAIRARATVLPAFVMRTSPGQYRAFIHEAIKPIEGTLRNQMTTMQRIYRGHLEHYLKTYPEQWGNLQPFWDRS